MSCVLQLFDFDREVQPVLEVLVGKVMEQSLLEVMEEEELACLRAQQRAFEERRNAEQAEMQRLQEQERRHTEEKVRTTAQSPSWTLNATVNLLQCTIALLLLLIEFTFYLCASENGSPKQTHNLQK